jgi:hypothetical protein
MAIIPFEQFDERVLKMEKRLNIGLAKGMNVGFKKALKLAVTTYIVRGGGAPNPPPGPLKWRSGDLGRSVEVFKTVVKGGDLLIGGLQAGGSDAPYAEVHEEKPGKRPFLKPALDDATDTILKEATKGVVREMRKFFDVS